MAYNNISLANYTGNKAEYKKWNKTDTINNIGAQ